MSEFSEIDRLSVRSLETSEGGIDEVAVLQAANDNANEVIDELRRQCWDIAQEATEQMALGKDWSPDDKGEMVVFLLDAANFDMMQEVVESLCEEERDHAVEGILAERNRLRSQVEQLTKERDHLDSACVQQIKVGDALHARLSTGERS